MNGLYGDKHRKALDQFFDDCCEYQIIFREVNIRGLMYTESRQGRPEFVIVDTIGEKNIIPFRSMLKSVNTRNIREVQDRIKHELEEISSKNR